MATYVPLTAIYDALVKHIPAGIDIDRSVVAIEVQKSLEAFYAAVDLDMAKRETEMQDKKEGK